MNNNGTIQTIASIILAIITFFYMILTRELVDEQQKIRQAQVEPHISIVIQPREEWLNSIDMTIQNLGNGPALKIKFLITPDFEHRNGQFLSQLGFFKYGISYLGARQRIRFPLTIITEPPRNKIKTKFNITVTYENSIGIKKTEIIPIDFTQFEGLTQLGVPPDHKIAREIEKIQKDIHEIASGKKIRVIRYTSLDEFCQKERERQEIEKLTQEET
jgi:hypothetical protein